LGLLVLSLLPRVADASEGGQARQRKHGDVVQVNQGVTLLTASVTAATGGSTVGAISDFTATATITYYWAGTTTEAAATVTGLAPNSFRIDASLPDGTRSYAITGGAGQLLSDVTGQVITLPFANTINAGVLAFPFFNMSAALSNSMTLISFLGLTTNSAGASANEVQVQQTFPPANDPNGICITDYYLDPVTSLVSQANDTVYPNGDTTTSLTHEADLQNYALMNGVQIPTFVQESIGGQITWQLSITSVTFNSGLTTANFVLH
jgi:hypothetical protein